MKSATGEMLAKRQQRHLWSPNELAQTYDDALGSHEIWDDVLELAHQARSARFTTKYAQSARTNASSIGDDPARLSEFACAAYLEVLQDTDIHAYVGALAHTRTQLPARTIMAANPTQYDLETLRSIRQTGADVCVFKNTKSPVPTALFEAHQVAVSAGFHRLGLTATIGLAPTQELADLMKQSNHITEELGRHPHTISLTHSQPVKDYNTDPRHNPLPLQIALIRLAHPYSNIVVVPGSNPSPVHSLLDAGANLITDPTAKTAVDGYRLDMNIDFNSELDELSYRRLPSTDHAGGLIVEFRTKSTQTYMLVRRPASPQPLGNNLHRGLYRSKDPETVVLVEGTLSITTRHPNRPEATTVQITSDAQAPHKLTVPRNVYHEVIADADSLLIEFSSVAEDTTDSFGWYPSAH